MKGSNIFGLNSFGIDLVSGMYRQLDFVNKICSNYDYWNSAEVVATAVTRYTKFMSLMADICKNPNRYLQLLLKLA